jgi:hypothetical protein
MADGWRKLNAPGSTAIAILMSVPLMLLSFIIVAGIVMLVASASLSQLTDFFSSLFTGSFSIEIKLLDILLGALSLALLMLVHELLHLVFIRGFLRSDKTYLGIMYAGFYVVTEEVLTRQRFIIISLVPFIVLSVLLPIVLGATGMLSPGLIILALLNAIGSSVDLLGLLLVIRQTPPGAGILCIGMYTYWKA